ncbi:DUF805 domain-containing protein [Croceicoccus gelatinilyticus]|uniref:DUF805 domain-containing protein n=1 Tax=Croceicoccus gelatinilyticus TaxID=2835536 RepID=UPI001BCE42E1|nr:DUF805 domain-containing protein [Croceicoccus gelatinilyticus]MBS7670708.1 DUF805 domain-containing protein [Croceicoccus gelatinilyticus]
MNLILAPYRRYFEIAGRSSRTEYWGFMALILVLWAITVLLGYAFGGRLEDGALVGGSAMVDVVNMAYTLFVIGSFIPSFTVSVRRLHDAGHSGFWLLMYFIPLIGALFMLYMMLKTGDLGSNAYGPDPRVSF